MIPSDIIGGRASSIWFVCVIEIGGYCMILYEIIMIINP